VGCVQLAIGSVTFWANVPLASTVVGGPTVVATVQCDGVPNDHDDESTVLFQVVLPLTTPTIKLRVLAASRFFTNSVISAGTSPTGLGVTVNTAGEAVFVTIGVPALPIFWAAPYTGHWQISVNVPWMTFKRLPCMV